jgi:hypothetical protein
MTKYIIFAGCSYAHKTPEIVEEIIAEKKISEFDGSENIKNIFIGNSSYSNKLIVESTITSVDTLLKNKVSPKNILVVSNFTQVGRENVLVPIELNKLIKNTLSSCDSENPYNIISKDYGGYIENQNGMYSLLTSTFSTDGYLKTWNKIQEDYFLKHKNPTLYFEEYLKDIVLLQSYLNKINVDSIFYMMSNTFEGWNQDFSHLYTSNKEWKLPSLKNTLHIKEISYVTKIMWEMIDFSKFVFYETEENKYGGIDEFFINEIVDKNELADLGSHSGHFYGRHPTTLVYEKFTKKIMSSKILDWKIKNKNLL